MERPGVCCADPKEVVLSIKAENAPADLREFLLWTQKHYHIDATTSLLFLSAQQTKSHLLLRAQVGANGTPEGIRKSIS